MEEQQQQQKPQRSAPHLRVPCARCASVDTKFCYYNNYNTSQPRYYCRACKRYWTHGGALRNVPEGGSSKKSKKKPSAAGAAIKLPRQHVQRDWAAGPAGIGNSDERTPLPPPPPPPPQFFYGCGGGDFLGEDICLLLGLINPSGMVGDMTCRPIPPGFVINRLDGVDLQQLAQQPCLSTAPQPSSVMLQQQQGNVALVDFAAGTTVTAAVAADTITEEIRSRSNSSFQHMSGTSFHPLPPSSSFM